MIWRRALVLAAFIAAGCAGTPAADPPAPEGWARDAALDPWALSGVTPTAASIAFALYEDVYELDWENCPFVAHTCSDANRSVTEDFIAVGQVRCRPTGPNNDRCTFTLVERIADGEPVKLRCTGDFNIVGTSHDPMRWGIMEDEYERLILRCRR